MRKLKRKEFAPVLPKVQSLSHLGLPWIRDPILPSLFTRE
jgi:hypothetical protein